MNGLMKFDPFAEMRALQKQFFGEDWFTPIKSLQLPTTDIYTKDNHMFIEAHLPNFEQKDIDIRVHDGNLEIQAEKHEKEEDKGKKYVVRESSASFYRSIRLPQEANADAIEADMKDGVLKVTVPFKALPEPKKIVIKSSNK